MKTLVSMVAAAASLTLVAACSNTEAELRESGAPPLTADQVSSIFEDATLVDKTAKGNPVYVYYAPDGEMKGLVTWSGGSESDAGKWEVVDDGQLCAQWENWIDGKRSCWQLYEIDGKLVWEDSVNARGAKVEESRIPEKGNTMDL